MVTVTHHQAEADYSVLLGASALGIFNLTSDSATRKLESATSPSPGIADWIDGNPAPANGLPAAAGAPRADYHTRGCATPTEPQGKSIYQTSPSALPGYLPNSQHSAQ